MMLMIIIIIRIGKWLCKVFEYYKIFYQCRVYENNNIVFKPIYITLFNLLSENYADYFNNLIN